MIKTMTSIKLSSDKNHLLIKILILCMVSLMVFFACSELIVSLYSQNCEDDCKEQCDENCTDFCDCLNCFRTINLAQVINNHITDQYPLAGNNNLFKLYTNDNPLYFEIDHPPNNLS